MKSHFPVCYDHGTKTRSAPLQENVKDLPPFKDVGIASRAKGEETKRKMTNGGKGGEATSVGENAAFDIGR